MYYEGFIFIIILILSIILHEIAHGYVADRLGDPTARLQGRLSMNPLVHMDWIGSVILPLFLVLSGAPFLLGWAKPIPVNPANMKKPKQGSVLVALAGPMVNMVIALLASFLLHLGVFGLGGNYFLALVIMTNVALAIFNLVPLPPLDGHHILFGLLPRRFYLLKRRLQKYSFFVLIAFVVFGWQLIVPIIYSIASFLL